MRMGGRRDGRETEEGKQGLRSGFVSFGRRRNLEFFFSSCMAIYYQVLAIRSPQIVLLGVVRWSHEDNRTRSTSSCRWR